MPCSVCEEEQSFSKLARIKNKKRSALQQARLNALSSMSIEHEYVKNIDFSGIIEQFSSLKTRKVPL